MEKGKAKSKAKEKAGELSVTASVSGPDGVTYTVTGCSVEEVRCALDEVKAANTPDTIQGAPSLQGDR
jgi:hypothetical protein